MTIDAAMCEAHRILDRRWYSKLKQGGDRKSAKQKSSRQNGNLARFTKATAQATGRKLQPQGNH